MSITRNLLKGMGLTEEQQATILEAHTETVDEIKAERDRLRSEAEKLPDIQKQLETAQADLDAARKDSYKVKYEALKEDFEDFKKEQIRKDTRTAKETAYRALLKEAGVNEKRIDAVLKVSDVDGVELDEKGAIKDAKDRMKSIKDEWSDFIVTTEVMGAQTPNPPVNTGGSSVTKDEIMKIKDVGERQRAIAQNMELFGIR